METPSRHSFNLNGSTRVFPVASPIKGDNYCRIEVDGEIINDRAKYDIVNNSIVFLNVADVPDGSQLDVLVVQSEEAIGQLAITTNIDIVASNITDINIVGADIANVNTTATSIANVNTVSGSIANVNLTGGSIGSVNTVAGSIANVNTTAGSIANVNTTATNIANVNTVAGNNANVTKVANIDTDVTTVADNDANVTIVADDIANVNTTAASIAGVNTTATNIANVNTVATNVANVNTVAGVSGNVTTVASIAPAVSTVSGNTANVTTVAGISGNVTTVAGIAGNVTTVANNNANVTAVAGNAADISAVAANNTNVSAVAGNATNINAVVANATNINTVAGVSTDVTTIATNIAAILDAPNQASGAAASAVSAASSAATAAALLDNFDDRYLGAKTSDPALDNDGEALLVGALYFNTTDGVMKIYTTSGWIAASSASVATMATFEFVATSGQTVFTGADAEGQTLSYTAPAVIVTLNGVRLRPGNDYTATDGINITHVTGATAGDELVVDAFGNFLVADTYSIAQADALLATKQETLVSGTNIKTVNSVSVVGSGNVEVQETLVSGTNIKTVNGGDILGSGDLTIEGVPSGAVQFFAMSAAPTGWVKANGAALSRTTYSDLFSAIGTTFGVGDGSTTFNVPDLRGEFLRGWDDGRGVDSGRAFGTAQAATQIEHMAAYGGDIIATNSDATNSVSRSKYNSGNTATFARSDIFTRPRNVALLACIKF